MLALKKVLINVDPVPILIFDEIDAQIGGRLGNIVGTKLKEISRKRQIILITHLPQIACFANKHLKVEKQVINNRTNITITALNKEKRLLEIAHMIGGKNPEKTSKLHAIKLLEKAN